MLFLDCLDKQQSPLKKSLGFVLIGLIALFDRWAGDEIALSLFYVLPISFLAWFTGQPTGFAAALLCAMVWLWADAASSHPYSSCFLLVCNAITRLAFFTTVLLLLSALRRAVEREMTLASTDHLTGAVNSRHFYVLVQEEINRFQRYGRVFGLVYLDLDNFKTVNDRWGHATGDEALQLVVQYMNAHIRRTDLLARLGGDEFALLLPETDADMVRIVCEKLQGGLLAEMVRHQWGVTFSIGVLTCQAIPPSVDELLKRADELMYAVKHGSKNGIQYGRFTESQPLALSS